MSGNKSKKGNNQSNFDVYRQIAPESVDDQTLRDIIKKNQNDESAISHAIENLWHDIPDQRAVGSEWVTTSKSRKPENAFRGSSATGRGGRGNGGRGRSLPPFGGRGAGAEGRGDKYTQRSSSVKAAGRSSPSSRTASSPTVPQDVEENVEEITEVVTEDSTPVPTPIPAPVVNTVIAAVSGVMWGQGGSLAEKLKRAEAEKMKVEVQEKDEAAATVSESSAVIESNVVSDAQKAGARSKGKRSKGGSTFVKRDEDITTSEPDDVTSDNQNIATETSNVATEITEVIVASQTVEQVPPPSFVDASANIEIKDNDAVPIADSNTTEVNASTSAQSFLKMGKWDAPVDGSEISTFQFGSFNNSFGEDSASSTVSASQVGNNPSATPWTGLHSSEDKTTNVWGAPSEQGLDMSAGLFPQPVTAGTNKALDVPADVNLNSNVAATRAPPGLAPKGSASKTVVSQAKAKSDVPQQIHASVPAQTSNTHNQNVPPGMNNRNVGGLGAGGLQYPYGQAFDLSQQTQFGGYGLGSSVAPVSAPTSVSSTAATTSVQSNTVSSVGSSSAAPNTNMQPPYANMQQPFQFYNPYYPNQYFYGQPQMPGYYGQGRDMYQQRGPYGANPYGNAGSLYPGDIYGQQTGQFPDAAGNYGMPLHPAMQNAGNANANVGASGNKTGKGGAATANANTVGSSGPAPGMAPDPHSANLLMNSYGYYGGRGGMDVQQGWQGYPGGQAGGWGAPMMPFPANPSPTNLGGGFPPPQAGGQQQGQNTGARSASGAYGGNTFGGRNSGSTAAPTGGVGTQGNW